jgi:hypothetical protein
LGLSRPSRFQQSLTALNYGMIKQLQGFPAFETERLDVTRFLPKSAAFLCDRTAKVQLIDPSDAKLAEVGHLMHLKYLSFGGTRAFTDVGLAHLAGLKEMKVLNLSQSQITDAGLAHLAGMTKMNWLNLSNTQINGAGLTHLGGMAGLTCLYLDNTAVTDACAEPLASLGGLMSLYLNGTSVTPDGVGHLEAALRVMVNH